MGQEPDHEDEAILSLIKGRDNLYVFNKSDLGEHPGFAAWLKGQAIPVDAAMTLSTLAGTGLDALRQWLRQTAGNPGENALTLARHMNLARQAADALKKAARAMAEGLPLDLCAVDLNEALAALGQITGDNFSEALLDEVFSTFCVGK